ncbi:MAG: hypothetical protein ACI88H_001694 [Cocleimonas sp.]|jgi:hypothetical protein
MINILANLLIPFKSDKRWRTSLVSIEDKALLEQSLKGNAREGRYHAKSYVKSGGVLFYISTLTKNLLMNISKVDRGNLC